MGIGGLSKEAGISVLKGEGTVSAYIQGQARLNGRVSGQKNQRAAAIVRDQL